LRSASTGLEGIYASQQLQDEAFDDMLKELMMQGKFQSFNMKNDTSLWAEPFKSVPNSVAYMEKAQTPEFWNLDAFRSCGFTSFVWADESENAADGDVKPEAYEEMKRLVRE
jgi:hypothetical protein